jgi:hypothetical protein
MQRSEQRLQPRIELGRDRFQRALEGIRTHSPIVRVATATTTRCEAEQQSAVPDQCGVRRSYSTGQALRQTSSSTRQARTVDGALGVRNVDQRLKQRSASLSHLPRIGLGPHRVPPVSDLTGGFCRANGVSHSVRHPPSAARVRARTSASHEKEKRKDHAPPLLLAARTRSQGHTSATGGRSVLHGRRSGESVVYPRGTRAQEPDSRPVVLSP